MLGLPRVWLFYPFVFALSGGLGTTLWVLELKDVLETLPIFSNEPLLLSVKAVLFVIQLYAFIKMVSITFSQRRTILESMLPCPRCGYALHSKDEINTTKTCPECGSSVEFEKSYSAWARMHGKHTLEKAFPKNQVQS